MLESPISMSPMDLILASGSPRRKQLLALFGIPFSVRPSDVDESLQPGEEPLGYVRRLAAQKGAACAECGANWVLSADTTVEVDGQILGKPADEKEARETLMLLRNREHQVHTAFCLLNGASGEALCGSCSTPVRMRPYEPRELEAYIESGDYHDKAGGYAIQNGEFHPASVPNGCYANVMGLPLCHIRQLMRKAGFTVEANIPALCQATLGITCDYYPAVELTDNTAGGSF